MFASAPLSAIFMMSSTASTDVAFRANEKMKTKEPKRQQKKGNKVMGYTEKDAGEIYR